MKLFKSGIVALLLLAGSVAAQAQDVQIIGGRPKGCPSRWCMCAISLELFGVIKPELNLAANWPKYFNAASPASGMVAARSGHGFLLKRHVEGNKWVVLDGNTRGKATGGRSKLIVHIRSIAGFKIVDPHSPKRQLATSRGKRNERHEHHAADAYPQFGGT